MEDLSFPSLCISTFSINQSINRFIKKLFPLEGRFSHGECSEHFSPLFSKLIYLKDRVRELSSHHCNIWHWPRLRPGAWTSLWISHTGSRDPNARVIFHCLSQAHQYAAGSEVEQPGLEPEWILNPLYHLACLHNKFK